MIPPTFLASKLKQHKNSPVLELIKESVIDLHELFTLRSLCATDRLCRYCRALSVPVACVLNTSMAGTVLDLRY